MKTPAFLRPVQQWFKTVGLVGKGPHASDVGSKKEPEVIKSPQHEKKKSK